MNEAETRAELIDPKLTEAGWGVTEGSRIQREAVITDGRILDNGRRGKNLKADYVLVYRNRKIAVIEAKSKGSGHTEGVGQAKEYARRLDAHFAFSTDGLSIYRINMRSGEECEVKGYPSPQELWEMAFAKPNEWQDRFSEVPLEDKSGSWTPRYYQEVAIQKALEAIANGKQRILLTLATGTGKTAIAFQLAWKLFKAGWSLNPDKNRRPRILFLADRNILANQALNMFSTFSAFDGDALKRVRPDEIRKLGGSVPTNASVFFPLFQSLASGKDEAGDPLPHFHKYPSDFFDFVIVDECHRGGANEESSWRGILEHFSHAVQLGLTATPRHDVNVDTYDYFGEPIYTYSLKEGISDGFLTPFKVKQYDTSITHYKLDSSDHVIQGEIDESKTYAPGDFGSKIEIDERTKYFIDLLMPEIPLDEKTLVFCSSIEEAGKVRDMINQVSKSKNTSYCVRVTSDDGELGDEHLRNFQDNEKTIPTILTTSRKLSTGVDARNIRHIVLMRPVKALSMVEFKQIIGRGTRLFDGKDYFIIHDFVEAYKNFNDESWDGDPADLTNVSRSKSKNEVMNPKDKTPEIHENDTPPEKRQIIKVKLAEGRELEFQHTVTNRFFDADGQLVSIGDLMRRLFKDLSQLCKNEDALRYTWSHPERRENLLKELKCKGYNIKQLEALKMRSTGESDLFDLLAYVAFALPPITRKERASEGENRILSDCNQNRQNFLEFVLKQYIAEGSGELSLSNLSKLLELKYGTISDAELALGKVTRVIKPLFIECQQHLYLKTA